MRKPSNFKRMIFGYGLVRKSQHDFCWLVTQLELDRLTRADHRHFITFQFILLPQDWITLETLQGSLLSKIWNYPTFPLLHDIPSTLDKMDGWIFGSYEFKIWKRPVCLPSLLNFKFFLLGKYSWIWDEIFKFLFLYVLKHAIESHYGKQDGCGVDQVPVYFGCNSKFNLVL